MTNAAEKPFDYKYNTKRSSFTDTKSKTRSEISDQLLRNTTCSNKHAPSYEVEHETIVPPRNAKENDRKKTFEKQHICMEKYAIERNGADSDKKCVLSTSYQREICKSPTKLQKSQFKDQFLPPIKDSEKRFPQHISLSPCYANNIVRSSGCRHFSFHPTSQKYITTPQKNTTMTFTEFNSSVTAPIFPGDYPSPHGSLFWDVQYANQSKRMVVQKWLDAQLDIKEENCTRQPIAKNDFLSHKNLYSYLAPNKICRYILAECRENFQSHKMDPNCDDLPFQTPNPGLLSVPQMYSTKKYFPSYVKGGSHRSTGQTVAYKAPSSLPVVRCAKIAHDRLCILNAMSDLIRLPPSETTQLNIRSLVPISFLLRGIVSSRCEQLGIRNGWDRPEYRVASYINYLESYTHILKKQCSNATCDEIEELIEKFKFFYSRQEIVLDELLSLLERNLVILSQIRPENITEKKLEILSLRNDLNHLRVCLHIAEKYGVYRVQSPKNILSLSHSSIFELN